jgi:hypothetical protein
LLDDVIAFNERHLKRLMSEYVRNYHEDRTHLAPEKENSRGPGKGREAGFKPTKHLFRICKVTDSIGNAGDRSRLWPPFFKNLEMVYGKASDEEISLMPPNAHHKSGAIRSATIKARRVFPHSSLPLSFALVGPTPPRDWNILERSRFHKVPECPNGLANLLQNRISQPHVTSIPNSWPMLLNSRNCFRNNLTS